MRTVEIVYQDLAPLQFPLELYDNSGRRRYLSRNLGMNSYSKYDYI
jgi:hypothetical protein